MTYYQNSQDAAASYGSHRFSKNGNVGRREMIPADKVGAFQTLAKKVIDYAGGHEAAAKLLAVDDGTLRTLMQEGKLTSRSAHHILAGYKLVKHHL